MTAANDSCGQTWAKDGRLLRLPQEDCCQVLAVPPSRKYQRDVGFVRILDLLKGGDHPATDQKTVIEAQMFFFLVGAIDRHAKNFSIFIGPGGSFRLTPLYDVLTVQPSVEAGRIDRGPTLLPVEAAPLQVDHLDDNAAARIEAQVVKAPAGMEAPRRLVQRMGDDA